MTKHFLNRDQVAARLGVQAGGLNTYALPEPDILIGPVNEDGSIPRGTTRGWFPETIENWITSRPPRRRGRPRKDRS